MHIYFFEPPISITLKMTMSCFVEVAFLLVDLRRGIVCFTELLSMCVILLGIVFMDNQVRGINRDSWSNHVQRKTLSAFRKMRHFRPK